METGSEEQSPANLYINAYYYMIMTVTTIGYGSSAYTDIEIVCCIFVEIIGVIGYGYLSGMLSTEITQLDALKAKQEEKIKILIELREELNMPVSLYQEIKSNIIYKSEREETKANIDELIDELPSNLQSMLQLEIHKELFSGPTFATRDYPFTFYGWLGAHLSHESASAGAVIYREGEAIHEIFLVHKGLVGYYLPRYRSYYTVVEPGCCFGHLDYRRPDHKDDSDYDDELDNSTEVDVSTDSADNHLHKSGRQKRQDKHGRTNPRNCRMFTSRAIEQSELVTLSANNLENMKVEFPEVYADFFEH